MSKKLILLVEDDKTIRKFISTALLTQDYDVKEAITGKEGISIAVSYSPDVVLLDLGLEDMDGIEVIKAIRQFSNIPIIVVSAREQDRDKVEVFDAGADDYLTKPFSLNELMARVHSLIRRYTQFNPVSCPDTDTLTFQGMTIDNVNRIVEINGIRAELTGKEFDLLSFLASNKGSIFTKKQIYNQVWEEEYAFDDSNIMSFISKLRKKIEPDPEHPFYILTVRGIGYRFNGEA